MTDNQSNYGPPGSILQEARLNAGKTVEETADALNLLIRYVEALEDNDYSRFNSPLFARGYVKAYARYMQLDEAPLLKDCERVCQRHEQSSAREKRQLGKARAPGNAPLVMAIVAALLIWLLSVWIFNGESEEPLEVTLLEQVRENSVAQKNSLGHSLLDKGAESQPQTALPTQVEEQLAVVKLHFSDTVWIELRDNNGNVVLSGVQQGGKDLQLTVLGPVELGTLNWPGMSMDYNDYPVKFEQVAEQTDSKAIRVRIGEL